MERGDLKRGGHLLVQVSTPSLEGSLLEGKGGHLFPHRKACLG